MLAIGVIGTGYVGLVHAVVMAEFGHHIIGMDNDVKKINQLKNGIVPIYEPGLEALLNKNMQEERIEFTSEIRKVVEESDVLFIAVGTPPKEDGSADLTYVMQVVSQIGQYATKDLVVVNKSTVPVGTGRLVEKAIQEDCRSRGKNIEIQVVSNPEFLREGKAIADTLMPERIVIGASSKNAVDVMKTVYEKQQEQGVPFVITTLETAEMIKYASNSFLAVKISFINEMAGLAEKVGADINQIALGMGLDSRISPEFLKAGAGYGGSCFPKDTKAIVKIGKAHKQKMLVINAAIEANKRQRDRMVEKIISPFEERAKGPLKERYDGLCMAVWGLSFKPDTDDMREAPSIDIIRKLAKRNIQLKVYCPGGMQEAKWRLEENKDQITYCKDAYEAAEEADALIIITEWDQFRHVDMERVKESMRGRYLFDLRNMFCEDTLVRTTFKYYGVGFNEEDSMCGQ